MPSAPTLEFLKELKRHGLLISPWPSSDDFPSQIRRLSSAWRHASTSAVHELESGGFLKLRALSEERLREKGVHPSDQYEYWTFAWTKDGERLIEYLNKTA